LPPTGWPGRRAAWPRLARFPDPDNSKKRLARKDRAHLIAENGHQVRTMIPSAASCCDNSKKQWRCTPGGRLTLPGCAGELGALRS
jgi:hypothetical protein